MSTVPCVEHPVPETDGQHNGSGSGSADSDSSSSGNRSSPCSYLTDDMDPMEIPSDEYLSAPTPPPRHHRQRRNAIFERRDPPPSALLQNDDSHFYHNEFEVASVSDINENPIEDANSTSGADDDQPHSPAEIVPENKGPEETDNNFADIETPRSDTDSDTTINQSSANRSKGLNSSDSELSDKDKWFCSQCNAKSMPYFRYCLRCFKMRRNWLPKRPPSRRLKRLKSRKTAQRNSWNNSRPTTRSSGVSDEGEDVVDGGGHGHMHRRDGLRNMNPTPSTSFLNCHDQQQPSSSQIQSLPATSADLNEGFLVDQMNPGICRLTPETVPGNITIMLLASSETGENSETTALINNSETSSETNSNVQSSSSQSQSQNFTQSSEGFSQASTSPPSPFKHQKRSQSPLPYASSPASQLKKKTDIILGSTQKTQCNICLVREKDAAFVHNKIAHHYCCYTCADKILKKNGKCPICRERVLRVVKIISV